MDKIFYQHKSEDGSFEIIITQDGFDKMNRSEQKRLLDRIGSNFENRDFTIVKPLPRKKAWK